MKVKELYTTESESALPDNKSKKIVTEEAYLVASLIEELIKKIEQTRISLLK